MSRQHKPLQRKIQAAKTAKSLINREVKGMKRGKAETTADTRARELGYDSWAALIELANTRTRALQ